MKIYSSLAIGAALVAASSMASADTLSSGLQSPTELTVQQMEEVTAGRKHRGIKHRHCRKCSGFAIADASANASGGRTNESVAFADTVARPRSAHSVASSVSYAGR